MFILLFRQIEGFQLSVGRSNMNTKIKTRSIRSTRTRTKTKIKTRSTRSTSTVIRRRIKTRTRTRKRIKVEVTRMEMIGQRSITKRHGICNFKILIV